MAALTSKGVMRIGMGNNVQRSTFNLEEAQTTEDGRRRTDALVYRFVGSAGGTRPTCYCLWWGEAASLSRCADTEYGPRTKDHRLKT